MFGGPLPGLAHDHDQAPSYKGPQDRPQVEGEDQPQLGELEGEDGELEGEDRPQLGELEELEGDDGELEGEDRPQLGELEELEGEDRRGGEGSLPP